MNKLSDLVALLIDEPELSLRAVAARLSVSKSAVHRYRAALPRCGRSPDELKHLAPKELDALFNRRAKPRDTAAPDFTDFETELKKKGVNLWNLWEDYRDRHGERALRYSRFTDLYRRHRRSVDVVLRQVHRPGETIFVDYSGAKPSYTDPATGKTVEVEMFVGVLGASNYTFVWCSHTQNELDWIDAHTRMLDFFGGAPQMLVCDNLRSAVSKAGRAGSLQHFYAQFAKHYGIAVLPARPYQPRDKGKVEKAVAFAQSRILAKLRHRTFHSLDELNAAVAERLSAMNAQPFKRSPESRRDRYAAFEKAALLPLPAKPFVYREWKASQQVPRDYHITVLGHDYSVPYELVGRTVEARVSSQQVEVFCDRARVAVHPRSGIQGGQTTDPAHQTPAHRAQGQRTREGFLHWATAVGPSTQAVVARQFDRRIPLQGLPACDALKNLAHRHGPEQVERAAARAMARRRMTVAGVKDYLPVTKKARDAAAHAGRTTNPSGGLRLAA